MKDEKISQEEIDASAPLLIAATDRLKEKHSEMVDEILKALKHVNSLHVHLRSNRIRKAEQNFLLLQKRAMEFHLSSYQIWDYLSNKEQESYNKLTEEAQFRLVANFVGIRKDFKEDRTIFLFLEHLEKRLSDKVTRLAYNRAMILSLAAILISVIPFVINHLVPNNIEYAIKLINILANNFWVLAVVIAILVVIVYYQKRKS